MSAKTEYFYITYNWYGHEGNSEAPRGFGQCVVKGNPSVIQTIIDVKAKNSYMGQVMPVLWIKITKKEYDLYMKEVAHVG